MKRIIAGILVGLCVLTWPVQAKANSLSYIPPEEVDGIPTEIAQNAEIIGNELDICPELLEAIAYYESRYTPTATNGSCKGLMQVNPTIHKARFAEAGWDNTEWSNAYKNIYVAGTYLRDLFEEHEDVGIVLGIYHGESNAIEKGRSGQLSSYVRKILIKSEELERAHGK